MNPKTFPTDWNAILENMERSLQTVLAQAERNGEIQDEKAAQVEAAEKYLLGKNDAFRQGLATRWETVETLLSEVDRELEEEEISLASLLADSELTRARLERWLAGEPSTPPGPAPEVPGMEVPADNASAGEAPPETVPAEKLPAESFEETARE